MAPTNLKEDQVFALVLDTIAGLNQKIDGEQAKLEALHHVGSGMQIAANEVFLFDSNKRVCPLVMEKKAFIKKRLVAENIGRYFLADQHTYLLYVEDVNSFEELPKSIQEHLEKHKSELSDRATIQNEGRPWWRYSRPVHREFYHLPKI